MRRLLLAALLLVLTASPAHAETVRPNPGTHRFTTTDALVQVLDGPDDTHQATIDTRLYVPDNATARTPQPAILMTHGFGLSKTAAEVTSMATFLARHGYVVLTYTAQGFGSSTGCVTLQSRTYDVKDAQQLITKVLQTKAFVKKDAKGAVVGTVGGSYGGGIQANLAERDSRVRAIAPGRTWNTLQYSLDPNNWVAPGDPTGFTHTLPPQGVFKAEWTSLFFASGNGNPVGGIPPTGTAAGTCPQEKLASGEPTEVAGLPCLGFPLAVCRTYAGLAATGDASADDKALVADSSGTTEIAKLTVPTLLVQGQRDTLFNVNDATATYLSLKRRGVPVHMVWNWGGHGGYDSRPGECEVYGGGHGGTAADGYKGLDDCYLSLRTLQFFDFYLRGTGTSGPGFSWYRDWVPYSGTGATKQYGDAKAFPLPATSVFGLTGTTLSEGAPGSGSATLLNPPGGLPAAYTETSNFSGPTRNPPLGPVPVTEVPGQHADWTSEPFLVARDSVGVPELTLTLSHLAPTDLVLFGKVYDVAPDGTAELVHRLIAPARIPSSALGAPVKVKLIGFAHRFGAGHRLRVTLATTDATSYNNKVADVITVSGGSLRMNLTAIGNDAVGPSVPKPAVPPSNPPGPTLPTTGLPGLLPLGVLLALGVALRRRFRAA